MKIFWLWKTVFKSSDNIIKDIEKNKKILPYFLFYLINSFVLLLLFIFLLSERTRISPLVGVDFSELNYFTLFVFLLILSIVLLFSTGFFLWISLKIVKGIIHYGLVIRTYVLTTTPLFIALVVLLIGNIINNYSYLVSSYLSIVLNFIAYLFLALCMSFVFYSIYLIFYCFPYFSRIKTTNMIIIMFIVFFLYVILFFTIIILLNLIFLPGAAV
ncbi:MAG: hypothetical protein QXG00_03615 [Candidatus Woesearchaeota archaeon]